MFFLLLKKELNKLQIQINSLIKFLSTIGLHL